ncbi:MAG: DUF4127 family protein, partial [Cyanobacteriota bacterium]
MKKILIIPMDDRPCTYDFPKQIAEIYGSEVLIPDKNFMGNLERIADRKEISNFILKNSNDILGTIIASDTLAYGGLIPSRRTKSSFEKIIKNFEVIKKLKENNSNSPLYVCSTIQRISDSNENQEEKEYWKDYGKLIHNYSYLLHKNNILTTKNYENIIVKKILTSNNEFDFLEEIKNKIPNQILEDYLNDRLRNLNVNKYLIDLVKHKYIDFLVISSDDSSSFGFNVIEREILKNYILAQKLENNVIMYPGADESVSVLTGRLINKINDFTPKFHCLYSETELKENIITMYEGIKIKETLKYQISSLGGVIKDKIDEADIILYIHTSADGQIDQYLNTIYKENIPKLSEEYINKDIENISNLLKNNQKVVLIDCAYANGSNNDFMSKLGEKIDLSNLLAYSSWNTTGNSIGTAIAHASVKYISKKIDNYEHFKFLFERFCDDWLYQGFERLNFIEKNNFPLNSEQLDEMKVILNKTINTFINKKFEMKYKFEIDELFFPWNRAFEI